MRIPARDGFPLAATLYQPKEQPIPDPREELRNFFAIPSQNLVHSPNGEGLHDVEGYWLRIGDEAWERRHLPCPIAHSGYHRAGETPALPGNFQVDVRKRGENQ